MRFLLPVLVLFIAACSADATRIRLVNNTAFNLENGELSFGSEPEDIDFLAAGDESRYFRFNGADDCNRTFTAGLQSFGEVAFPPDNCVQPLPIAPGKYSLVLTLEPFVNPDGTTATGAFLRLRED